MSRLVILAAITLASAAHAQLPSIISPRGSEFFEGNSSSNIMLGNLGTSTRVQQVDNTLVGQFLPVINSLAWRRNGTGGGQQKTTTLSVTMSHADINLVTSAFASNYKDPPQVVFAQRPVNLPDWSAPINAAPLDAVLQLDFPFAYNGTDALLWEVTKDNDPGTAYSQDWISSMPTDSYGDYPLQIAGGCTTANGAMIHRTALRVSAGQFEFGFRVQGAPASTPVTVLLGFSDPNISLPGLCASIRTLVEASVPLGAADPAGDIALSYPVTLPWNAAYANAPLFTQAVALDPTQPGLGIALSGGLQTSAPASATARPLDILRLYNTTSSTAATGTGPTASAAPTKFGI